MTTRGTNRGFSAKVKLHRDELAEIVDALAEMRDSTGERAGELELRLSDLIHRGDRQLAIARRERSSTR